MMSIRADSFLDNVITMSHLVGEYTPVHGWMYAEYTYLQMDVGCTHTLQCRMYVYLANTCRVCTHLCIANVTTKY